MRGCLFREFTEFSLDVAHFNVAHLEINILTAAVREWRGGVRGLSPSRPAARTGLRRSSLRREEEAVGAREARAEAPQTALICRKDSQLFVQVACTARAFKALGRSFHWKQKHSSRGEWQRA